MTTRREIIAHVADAERTLMLGMTTSPTTIRGLVAGVYELRERIDAALACYGPDFSKRLGEPRYSSADEFLIAIRNALLGEDR